MAQKQDNNGISENGDDVPAWVGFLAYGAAGWFVVGIEKIGFGTRVHRHVFSPDFGLSGRVLIVHELSGCKALRGP